MTFCMNKHGRVGSDVTLSGPKPRFLLKGSIDLQFIGISSGFYVKSIQIMCYTLNECFVYFDVLCIYLAIYFFNGDGVVLNTVMGSQITSKRWDKSTFFNTAM